MSERQAQQYEEPVRILSDLHLAHPASSIGTVESLRPLVAGAKTVIFNGDSCELSYSGWKGEAEVQMAMMRSLCAEEGVHPVFLPGNHDPGIGEAGWCELAGGRIFVTHGHAIYPSVAPWSYEYLWKKQQIQDLINTRKSGDANLAHRWETTRLITELLKPDRTRKLGKRGRKYLLSAVWPPERGFNILRVWLTMVGAADRFVARYAPKAEVIVFGHFHRSGIWRRRGRTICNTGAFMRGSRPLVAELSEESLRVYPALQSRGSFRPGPDRRVIQVDRE